MFRFLVYLLYTFNTLCIYIYIYIYFTYVYGVCTSLFDDRKYFILRCERAGNDEGQGKNLFYDYYYYYFCLRLIPKTNLRPGNLSTRTRLRDAPQAFGTAVRGNEIKQMPLANNCSAQTPLYTLYNRHHGNGWYFTKASPLRLSGGIVCLCHDCGTFCVFIYIYSYIRIYEWCAQLYTFLSSPSLNYMPTMAKYATAPSEIFGYIYVYRRPEIFKLITGYKEDDDGAGNGNGPQVEDQEQKAVRENKAHKNKICVYIQYTSTQAYYTAGVHASVCVKKSVREPRSVCSFSQKVYNV